MSEFTEEYVRSLHSEIARLNKRLEDAQIELEIQKEYAEAARRKGLERGERLERIRQLIKEFPNLGRHEWVDRDIRCPEYHKWLARLKEEAIE